MDTFDPRRVPGSHVFDSRVGGASALCDGAEAAAAFPADALDAPSPGARADPAEARTGDRSVADARVIAALILGLDRGGTRETRSGARRADPGARRRRSETVRPAPTAKEEEKTNKTRRVTDGVVWSAVTKYRAPALTTATPPWGWSSPGRVSRCSGAGRGAACRRVSDEPRPPTRWPRRPNAPPTSASTSRFSRTTSVGGGGRRRRRARRDGRHLRASHESREKADVIRLVLFRSDETRERASPRSRAGMLSKNIKTYPPCRLAGPGVKRATYALARTIGGAVVLDALAVEPGDLAFRARLVRRRGPGHGRFRRADGRAETRHAPPLRLLGEDGEEEKRLRRNLDSPPPCCSDRRHRRERARGRRRTMRRASHALACPFSREASFQRRPPPPDWSLLFRFSGRQ